MEAEDLIKIADAIGDILYFVYGDAVAYGIPVIPVFNEIHRSNMTKSPCLDKDGKAVKGLDYSPPNLEKALRGVGEGMRRRMTKHWICKDYPHNCSGEPAGKGEKKCRRKTCPWFAESEHRGP